MLINLPSRLDAAALRSLIKSWPDGPVAVELHFNDRQWATPTGMVGLACLIDRLRRGGGKVQLEFNNCNTVGYWERMGFFRAVELDAPDCPPSTPRAAGGRFAEMRRVFDINDVDAIADELVMATQTTEEGFRTFSHILCEAMNNVCQHSRAWGYSAAQYWRRTGWVEFCIADFGQGLLSALAASHAPGNDAEAIALALKVGVTSNSPNFGQPQMRNRGVGLSCIERLVTANGGRFEIWSGLGRFTNTATEPVVTGNSWTGTLLTVNMSRDELSADFRFVMKHLTEELHKVEAERRRHRTLA